MQWKKWKRDLLFRFRRLQMKSFSDRVTYLSNLHLISEDAIRRELEIQETAESIGILKISSRQKTIDRLLAKRG